MWAKVFWTSTKLNLWMRTDRRWKTGRRFHGRHLNLEKRLSRSIRNSNPCLSIGSRVSMAIGVNICIMTADCILRRLSFSFCCRLCRPGPPGVPDVTGWCNRVWVSVTVTSHVTHLLFCHEINARPSGLCPYFSILDRFDCNRLHVNVW